MIGRWSHREYRTRLQWLDDQWNEPSRSDHYLMQIAAEIRRVLSKKPNAIKLDHLKLPFEAIQAKAPVELTKSQSSKIALARWAGLVGLKEEAPRRK